MSFKLINHVIRNQRFFVYKINDISYRERLFCILDTERPFELTLRYKELGKSLDLAPIFVGGKAGFQLQEKTDLEKIYWFRFETAEECQKNIDEIKIKKELIDEMLDGFTEDMMLDHNRKMMQKISKNREKVGGSKLKI
jgi:hypothetical protein